MQPQPQPQAQPQRQLYLVTFEYVEVGPLYGMDNVVKMVDKGISMSLDAVVQLAKQPNSPFKAGGVFAGSKGSAMILEVSGHKELSETIQSFPFWSIMKVRVTPLQSFEERSQQEKTAVGFLKGALTAGQLDWW
jgi:hypothetical protein